MLEPYIGITGFMEREEISHLLERVPDYIWGGRQLMVGILVSHKTKNGQSNRWPGSYPTMDKLKELCVNDPRCLNLIHYNTDYPEQLVDGMEDLLEIAGPYCHGFQVNMAWPEVEGLADFRSRHPQLRIVLQLGKRAFDENKYGGKVLRAERVMPYMEAKAITDILYDPSGGLGEFNEPYHAIDTLLKLKKVADQLNFPLGLGLAGGLRAERLWNFREIPEMFPRLSTDAQGQLRWPEHEPYTNRLDLPKAYAYLICGLIAFHHNLFYDYFEDH